MAKILVAFYSRGGSTKKMAEKVAEAVSGSEVECDLREASELSPDELMNYEGIIFGSPTYYGHPAYQIKQLIDGSVKFHGKMSGRVGGAFASCGVLGGGAETTVRALLDALLIHGMVIQGTPSGGHFGPISVGKPDDKALKECKMLGERTAELVKKLYQE